MNFFGLKVNMHSFSASGKASIFAFLFFITLYPATAQTDYKITSLDGEFSMEVSRVEPEVKIVIHFRDASQYHHALIEKTDELKNEFRQCAYVALTEEKQPDMDRRDRYPRISTDSYYRLRTVTKEGVERTYPAVRLPAKVVTGR